MILIASPPHSYFILEVKDQKGQVRAMADKKDGGVVVVVTTRERK